MRPPPGSTRTHCARRRSGRSRRGTRRAARSAAASSTRLVRTDAEWWLLLRTGLTGRFAEGHLYRHIRGGMLPSTTGAAPQCSGAWTRLLLGRDVSPGEAAVHHERRGVHVRGLVARQEEG